MTYSLLSKNNAANYLEFGFTRQVSAIRKFFGMLFSICLIYDIFIRVCSILACFGRMRTLIVSIES